MKKELFSSHRFPFDEGDDYWVIEDDGTLSTLSCWDDQSEIMHLQNPDRKYFSSEKEGLEYINNLIETYTFSVPCSMVYDIEAQSEEEARKLLLERGGYSVRGEIVIDGFDYQEAILVE